VKAGAAWYLHEFLAGCPLDWFVLYSSAAALLGAPGQANHAAANAFLDALAHARHGLGLPALSINWGPWAAHGAIVDDRLAFLEQRGWAPITAAQAFQALETFLANRTPQAAMFQLDFHAWQRYYPDAAHSRFLARLNGLPHSPAVKVRSRTAQETQSFLVEQAADVLRCPLTAIDPTRPLREFGLDSLRALELRNRIQAALGIHLPATIMWRYPVISALSRHIHELARQTQKP
jgi:myxalamid-type polyketide synthase MxaE and MxaD